MPDRQALIDAVEPERPSQLWALAGVARCEARATPDATPPTAAPQRRSPLPSVREIDRQLEQKYGVRQYRELQSWRAF